MPPWLKICGNTILPSIEAYYLRYSHRTSMLHIGWQYGRPGLKQFPQEQTFDAVCISDNFILDVVTRSGN